MKKVNPAPRIGRPPKYESAEKLEAAISAYFKSCWEYRPVISQFGPVMVNETPGDPDSKKVILYEWVRVRPYTVTGLALACGMDRHQLLNYGEKEEFYHTIKRAKEHCQQFAEEMLFELKNSSGAQFSLMNNWNWKAKSEQDMNIKGNLEIAERAQRARERANAK